MLGWERQLAAENLESLLEANGLVLTDSRVLRRRRLSSACRDMKRVNFVSLGNRPCAGRAGPGAGPAALLAGGRGPIAELEIGALAG